MTKRLIFLVTFVDVTKTKRFLVIINFLMRGHLIKQTNKKERTITSSQFFGSNLNYSSSSSSSAKSLAFMLFTKMLVASVLTNPIT